MNKSILASLLTTTCLLVSVISFAQRDESNDYCRKAVVQFDAKDYKDALVLYSKAVKADSTYGLAWEGRGSCEYYLGDYTDAHYDELKAFKLEPSLKYVRNWIGLIELDMGDYSNAINWFNKSIDAGTNPEPAKDYQGRGEAEYYLQQYDKGLEDEKKAISLDSTMGVAYNFMGLIEQEQGSYQNSIYDFNNAIRLAKGKNCAKDYTGRAMGEYYLNDYTNALNDMNTAMAMDTTLKNAYNQRGLIKEALKDYKGAMEDYARSLKIPGNKHMGMDYEGKAIAEYHLGDYKAALQDIDMAIKTDSSLKNAAGWKTEIESKLK